jgi:hypothetical protein
MGPWMRKVTSVGQRSKHGAREVMYMGHRWQIKTERIVETSQDRN